MFYVNNRWLGGTLTNFQTIKQGIDRLKKLEETMEDPAMAEALTKREMLEVSREALRLNSTLGGIKAMRKLPDALFVIDTKKEDIAVREANKLRIPVVAVLDSNSTPDGIAYPIPGNDDAMRAIHLSCDLVAGAVLDGLQAELVASGIDIGSRDQVADEAAIADGEGVDERGDQEVDGEPLPTMDEAMGSEGEANGASA